MSQSRKNFIVGCVADCTAKYMEQALRLLQSWRWFGGAVANAEFHVCVVDKIDLAYKRKLEGYGAIIHVVPRFSVLHPPSNKLRFLELRQAHEADRVLLLDCDTIIVQDPSALLDGDYDFMAKIADMPSITQDVFVELFAGFGVALPPQHWRCTVRGEPIIPYFNAGVLSLSRNAMAQLVPQWIQFNHALIDRLNILGDYSDYCEQASLSLAIATCEVRFIVLSNEMNFPGHYSDLPRDSAFARTDPVIIHYHSMTDEAGYLMPSRYSLVNNRIQQFNARLRAERGSMFEKRAFQNNFECADLKPDSEVGAFDHADAKKMEFRPVFVVGAMRSGTTLLAELLGYSEHICHCPFELKDIWSRVAEIPIASAKTRDIECPELVAEHVDMNKKMRLMNAFIERMKACVGKVPGSLFLSKNPHLCNKLPFVLALFPEAHFIWIYRDLPQVVASLKRLFAGVCGRQGTWHWWPESSSDVRNRCWHAFHKEGERRPPVAAERIFPGGRVRYLAEYWLESNRAVSEFFTGLGETQRFSIAEEDLVFDPARELARCFAQLGMPFKVPRDLRERVDPLRNSEWKSLLSDEEMEQLQEFILQRGNEIDKIFPCAERAAQYLNELGEVARKSRARLERHWF